MSLFKCFTDVAVGWDCGQISVLIESDIIDSDLIDNGHDATYSLVIFQNDRTKFSEIKKKENINMCVKSD